MATTSRLIITEMVVGQSGGENLFNAALRNLDIAVFPAVIDRDLTAPPGSETGGEVYIPAATATVHGREKKIVLHIMTMDISSYNLLKV